MCVMLNINTFAVYVFKRITYYLRVSAYLYIGVGVCTFENDFSCVVYFCIFRLTKQHKQDVINTLYLITTRMRVYNSVRLPLDPKPNPWRVCKK